MNKLIQISQRNALKLNDIFENQEKLEVVLNEQNVQISRILDRLDQEKINPEADVKGKVRGKGKKTFIK